MILTFWPTRTKPASVAVHVRLDLERRARRHQGDDVVAGLHHRAVGDVGGRHHIGVLIGAQIDELTAQLGLGQVLLGITERARLVAQVLARLRKPVLHVVVAIRDGGGQRLLGGRVGGDRVGEAAADLEALVGRGQPINLAADLQLLELAPLLLQFDRDREVVSV